MIEAEAGDMTIDSTVKKIDSPAAIEMLAGGGLAAVVIFSVGVFLLVIPVIGWLVGPALMIAAGLIAIAHVTGIFWRKAEYTGHCPYCDAPAVASEPGSVGVCGACKNKFVHRDGQLCKIG